MLIGGHYPLFPNFSAPLRLCEIYLSWYFFSFPDPPSLPFRAFCVFRGQTSFVTSLCRQAPSFAQLCFSALLNPSPNPPQPYISSAAPLKTLLMSKSSQSAKYPHKDYSFHLYHFADQKIPIHQFSDNE